MDMQQASITDIKSAERMASMEEKMNNLKEAIAEVKGDIRNLQKDVQDIKGQVIKITAFMTVAGVVVQILLQKYGLI